MAKQAKTGIAKRDGILLWTWVLAVAVILITVFVRIRLLGTPLERDEGEFACVGQLILKGIPPYELAVNMKLPGIYAVYALIMSVFGQTITGIHIGLLLANLTTTGLVFLLGRRLWNTQVALIAAASYPVLTLGGGTLGLAAHATQFQMPMVLGGLILLLKALESDRQGALFLSGLLMGLAFVTKQQAVLFAAFGGFYLIWDLIRSRSLTTRAIAYRVAIYALGCVIPFAVVCLIMYQAGVFEKFWFWTFTYAGQYVSQTPLLKGLSRMVRWSWRTVDYTCVLTALSVVGLIAVLRDTKLRKHAVFVVSLSVFSFLAVCPGLYFREHYFVQTMPATALLVGLAVMWISRLLSRRQSAFLRAVPLLLFLVAVVHAFAHSREIFFRATLSEVSQMTYGGSPFEESIEVGRYMKKHSKPGDRIAVLGSEPQIYFYADRLPAMGCLYAYPLMEPQPFARKMQQDIIREIEAAKPKYIVYVNVSGSWLFRKTSDTTIVFWFAKYASKHYKIVGLADMVLDGQAEYIWGEEAAYFAPDAPVSLCVFERKSEPLE